LFTLKCPDCGGRFRDRDRFCPHCGADLEAPIEETEEQPAEREATPTRIEGSGTERNPTDDIAVALAILDQWLPVKGFEKTRGDEPLYIRDSSPDKLFTHTALAIRVLKEADERLLDTLLKDKGARKKITEASRAETSGGRKTASLVSEAGILKYVLFLAEHVDDRALNKVSSSSPAVPGLCFYSLFDVAKKRIAITGKRSYWSGAYFEQCHLDITNLLMPLVGPPVVSTPDVEALVDQWRFLSPNEGRERRKLYTGGFSKCIEHYSTYANQALFDVTFRPGEDSAKKAILAYYLADACLEKLVPTWDIEAGTLGFEAGVQQVERDVQLHAMRKAWLTPFSQVLRRFVEGGTIQMIGYCKDCGAVQTELSLAEDTIVCPVSEKHKHIPHTLYVTSEERQACCQGLEEAYRKRRGLFG